MNLLIRRTGRGLALTPSAATIGAMLALAAFMILTAQPAAAQWQIKSEDGNASLKLGFLVQGRAEWLKTEDIDGMGQTMYLRRARILLGGKVNERVSFFLETDNPNLGRRTGAPSTKNYPSTYLQDCILTWNIRPGHMIDAGLLLTPDSYNHLQSAATLLPMDYGPYTFVESGHLGSSIGRDTGLQLRGLLAEKMVEYRVGVFQGRRVNTADKDSYRAVARLSVHPFKTASSSYFYGGTMLGKARTLAIGGSADFQKGYQAIHGDIFFEEPVAPGSCLTVQGDLGMYDPGDDPAYIPLAEQTTWMAEAGFAVKENRFGPFVQVSGQNYKEDSQTDWMIAQVGLFYRLDGHRENFKLGISQRSGSAPDGVDDPKKETTIALQYQVFYF